MVIHGCLCPHQSHTPPCLQDTEQRLTLKPTELAAGIFVLILDQNVQSTCPKCLRTRCSNQTSHIPSRHPGDHEAKGRLATPSLYTYPWYTCSQVLSVSLFYYSPQKAFNSTSPIVPSGGQVRNPRCLVMLAFGKGHQTKPGSSKQFIRSIIFGMRSGFKP